ncbi:hypothetical protein BH11BAC1_BH11BAC1_02480 [soil metagenome]
MISKNNYESFFLDYHEGNLSEELKKEVRVFLDSNPELKEEFESFEIISLSEKSIVFSGKEKLKKSAVNEYNFKTWFVACEENDLNAADRKQVEQFLEINPAYKPELEILKQTKILPDYSIHFENKASLKKGGILIPLWVRIAAAACLVIGLLSYWMIQQKPKSEFVIEPGSGKYREQNPAIVPSHERKVIEEMKTVVEGNQKTIEKNNLQDKRQKPGIRKTKDNQVEKNLANRDSTPNMLKEHIPVIQPLANNTTSQTTIVINENKNKYAQPSPKLVVLDDSDLAELGLKSSLPTTLAKTPEESKSLLADAVNGVGKIFNVNAHYNKEPNPSQSKYTETLALGPVAITRTISR